MWTDAADASSKAATCVCTTCHHNHHHRGFMMLGPCQPGKLDLLLSKAFHCGASHGSTRPAQHNLGPCQRTPPRAASQNPRTAAALQALCRSPSACAKTGSAVLQARQGCVTAHRWPSTTPTCRSSPGSSPSRAAGSCTAPKTAPASAPKTQCQHITARRSVNDCSSHMMVDTNCGVPLT